MVNGINLLTLFAIFLQEQYQSEGTNFWIKFVNSMFYI